MGREIATAILRYPHLLQTHAQPELVAVSDIDSARMDWFTTEIATVRQAETDYRALLANPEIDAIYCAVPHHLHQSVYTDIIRAGKALLAEKPFGIDQTANQAILDVLAEYPDAFVRCSSEFPFYPGAVALAERVRSGRLGRIIEAEAGFWHASDLDPEKPSNWKRQVATNGAYGCLGDLGLHVVHLPMRLNWRFHSVYAQLSNIITERPDGRGGRIACDTWDNADLAVWASLAGEPFPLRLSTKRLAPGHQNTWFIRVVGTQGAVAFSTKWPKTLESLNYVPGGPQGWTAEDLPYRSAFATVTGPIFEFGFSDAILQMIAAFTEEYVGHAVTPWGCVTAEETARSHRLFTQALASADERRAMDVEP
jgi:predicted dehydrogenase